ADLRRRGRVEPARCRGRLSPAQPAPGTAARRAVELRPRGARGLDLRDRSRLPAPRGEQGGVGGRDPDRRTGDGGRGARRSGVGVFELDVSALPEARRFAEYRDVSRFPPVRRDLAFLVAASVPSGAIAEGIVEAAGGLAGPPVLFDLFDGQPLPPGTKNVAYA